MNQKHRNSLARVARIRHLLETCETMTAGPSATMQHVTVQSTRGGRVTACGMKVTAAWVPVAEDGRACERCEKRLATARAFVAAAEMPGDAEIEKAYPVKRGEGGAE